MERGHNINSLDFCTPSPDIQRNEHENIVFVLKNNSAPQNMRLIQAALSIKSLERYSDDGTSSLVIYYGFIKPKSLLDTNLKIYFVSYCRIPAIFFFPPFRCVCKVVWRYHCRWLLPLHHNITVQTKQQLR